MAGRFSNLEFDEERQDTPVMPTERAAQEPSARHYFKLATEAERWGEFEPALRNHTRCLREDRLFVPAWVGQVQMLVQLGEYHEARVWSDKALELFRNNGELLAAKAQACVRLGDKKTAQQCSDAALQAPGGSPRRWQVRGELLLANREKHYEECFQKAVGEPTADWFDSVIIARIYDFYRRTANALRYLKKALEQEPAHGYVWFEIGNCERQLGLATAARESYGRCLDLRPGYRPAENALDTLEPGTPLGWLRRAFRRRR